MYIYVSRGTLQKCWNSFWNNYVGDFCAVNFLLHARTWLPYDVFIYQSHFTLTLIYLLMTTWLRKRDLRYQYVGGNLKKKFLLAYITFTAWKYATSRIFKGILLLEQFSLKHKENIERIFPIDTLIAWIFFYFPFCFDPIFFIFMNHIFLNIFLFHCGGWTAGTILGIIDL